MNKQEVLEKIAELRERIDKLEEMCGSAPNERWRAEKNGDYYFVNAEGRVYLDKEDGMVDDDMRYAIDNYFRTKEQAEFEAERLRVISELRKCATPPSEFDWDSCEERKYTILLESNEVKIDFFCFYQSSDLYFKTKEQAEEAIRAVGKDRIIKYYFRRG